MSSPLYPPTTRAFRIIAVLVPLLFATLSGRTQTLIAGWDFQTATTGGTVAAAAPGSPTVFNANFGTGTIYLNGSNGAGTWVTAVAGNELTSFTGTAVNAGAGFATSTTAPACVALLGGLNGTATNGKAVVFRFSMAGRANLVVSYAAQRSATGYSAHTWEYSPNGTTWTPAQLVNSIPAAFGTITLTTITGLDNVASAYLRFTGTGASAAAGNNRLDNIQLSASVATDTDGDGVADSADGCPLMVNGLANTNAATCTCEPGYYPQFTLMSGSNVITAALICPAGSSCPDGLSRSDCQPGSYQSLEGQTTCLSCAAGSHSSVAGSVVCASCDAQSSSEQGAAECFPDYDDDNIADYLDQDDDNDGILTAEEGCEFGELGWISSLATDNDHDGCRDATEDLDDDNDGALDATDVCPLDASKSSSSGACGCGTADVATLYFHDLDNDGFGDPNDHISSFTCVAPPALYVADDTDDCPSVSGKSGSTCSNGECSTNDVLSAACQCTGTPRPEGTVCSTGTCQGGVCTAVSTFSFTVTNSGQMPSGCFVTSTPTGIDCGTICSSSFAQGSVITLHAQPALHHVFIGWSGDCTGTGDCVTTMDGDKSASALFAVDADDDGDPVTTDCDDNDAARFHGAAETCDGVDQDCDTQIDEGYTDTDNDNARDCVDPDDDNDGLSDADEALAGTEPLDPDTDGDTVLDGADGCPLDASRTAPAAPSVAVSLSPGSTNPSCVGSTVHVRPVAQDGGTNPLYSASVQYPGTSSFVPLTLDIDGNGQVDALTDGLLLVRYVMTSSITCVSTPSSTVTSQDFAVTISPIQSWYPDVDGDLHGDQSASATSGCTAPFAGAVTTHDDCDDNVVGRFTGETCDDGNSCTGDGIYSSACQCASTTPVTDGTVCSGGTCQGGVCTTMHLFTVTNSGGAASGTISSTPAGIDCGTTCSSSFAQGSVVTLHAQPALHRVFSGWSGASCSGTGDCVAVMDAPRSATATFDLDSDDDGLRDDLDGCHAVSGLSPFDYGTCSSTPGHYLEFTDVEGVQVVSAVSVCPTGSSCPNGVDRLVCPSGEFSSVMGALTCETCSGGTDATTGATMCLSYPGSPYCAGSGTASPSLSGGTPGGTFTCSGADCGLVDLDPLTGDIDLPQLLTLPAVLDVCYGLTVCTQVTINPSVTPSVHITGASSSLCAGEEMELTAEVTGGGTSPVLAWRVDNVVVQTGGLLYVFGGQAPGDHVVRCTLSSSTACALPEVDDEVLVAVVAPPTWYPDVDGDGFGDASSSVQDCAQPTGFVGNDDDCDDVCSSCNPASSEVCDGRDNDCDGAVPVGEVDDDNDTFVECAFVPGVVWAGPLSVSGGGDCDDTDPGIFPRLLMGGVTSTVGSGGTTSCAAPPLSFTVTGVFSDATTADITESFSWARGAVTLIGSGFSAATFSPPGTMEGDVTLTVSSSRPCVSNSPFTFVPLHVTVTDAVTLYLDGDDDGFGDALHSVEGCVGLPDYLDNDDDCDDSRGDVHPGAAEVCDASNTDEDCDGLVDELDYTFYVDLDGDNFGSLSNGAPLVVQGTCSAPPATPLGRSLLSTDCDDNCASCNPSSSEVCDSHDNDCDSSTDEDCDNDSDDYCDSAMGFVAPCGTCPNGAGDCDDDDASVHPGAPDPCGDGVDQDCSGGDALSLSWYPDVDGDLHGDASASATQGCTAPFAGAVTSHDDCDDTTFGRVIGETCDDGSGCTGSDVYSASCVCTGTPLAVVTPTLTVTSAGGVSSTCHGSSVTFTAEPSFTCGSTPHFLWFMSVGGGPELPVGTDSPQFTADALTDGLMVIRAMFGLTGTAVTNGFVSSETVPVTVGATISSTIDITVQQGSSNPTCSGTPVTFHAVASGGGSAPLFEWTKGGGASVGFSDTYTDNGTVPGVVRCAVTSSATCASPATALSNEISLAIAPTATPTLSLSRSDNSSAPVCHGTPVTFTASATNTLGGTPEYHWLRSLDGGAEVEVGTDSPTYTEDALTDGLLVIRYLFGLRGSACTASLVPSPPMELVVSPLVSLATASVEVFSGTNPACEGAAVEFRAVGTFSDGTSFSSRPPSEMHYDFHLDGALAQSSLNPYYSNPGISGTMPLDVSVSSTRNCLSSSAPLLSAPLPVVRLALPPVAAITGGGGSGGSLCIGSPVQLSNATPNGLWSSSDDAVATVSSNGIAAGVVAGIVIARYTVSDGQCSNVAELPLTVAAPPAPPAPITGGSSVCTGSELQLDCATPDVVWSSGDGSVFTISNAPGTRGRVTGVAAGTTTVRATFSDASTQCSSSSELAFTVVLSTSLSAPVVSLSSGSNPTCSSSAVEFTATGTYSDGSSFDGDVSYVWSPGGITVHGSSFFAMSAPVSGAVSCTVTSSRTCVSDQPPVESSNSVQLVVTPVLTIDGSLLFIEQTLGSASTCSGSDLDFRVTGTYSDGSSATDDLSATWTNGVVTLIGHHFAFSASASSSSVSASDVTSSRSCVSNSGSVAPPAPFSLSVSPAVGLDLVTMELSSGSNPTCEGTALEYRAIAHYSDGSSSDSRPPAEMHFDWFSGGALVQSSTNPLYQHDGLGETNPLFVSASSQRPCLTGPVSLSSQPVDVVVSSSILFAMDADLDNFYVTASVVSSCSPPSSLFRPVSVMLSNGGGAGDCDDQCSSCNPGSSETCDDRDNDCDGAMDEDCDDDGDDYCDFSLVTVGTPVACPHGGGDCDDSDASRNPGATELCDPLDVDEDCDFSSTNGLVFVDFALDADLDNFFVTSSVVSDCSAPSSLYRPVSVMLSNGGGAGDCDDSRAAVFPAAPEQCDGRDDDCDGFVPSSETDDDNDGYVECAFSSVTWGGSVLVFGGYDCDDSRSDVHPGGTETCDAGNADEDCDGLVNEGDHLWYVDSDDDGYGSAVSVSMVCTSPPTGFADNDDDCDDLDADRHPNALELCDGVDQDCDLLADDGDNLYFRDLDLDGYGDPLVSVSLVCTSPPSGFVVTPGDCDDSRASVHPGALEVCDGLDNDCNSASALDNDCDDDGDGYCDFSMTVTPTATCVHGGGDCDDTDSDTHPGATETCDGGDEDCDGAADDGLVFADFALDADLDNFYVTASVVSSCSPPSSSHRLVTLMLSNGGGAGDCDDSRSSVHPLAFEQCDDLDNDCSSATPIDNGCDDDNDDFCDFSMVTTVSSTCSHGGGDCDDTRLLYADLDGDGFGAGAPTACGVVSNTDNCPTVSGVVGSTCDDNNAATSNDVLSASCVCQGSTVVTCTQNAVVLTLTTDAFGTQTSYDIVAQGSTAAACSGSGMASSSVITANCCLPDGCYDLHVYDSAGDGISAPGGFVLRTGTGKRIIDNTGNGALFVSTSSSPLGFCMPLGTDALKPTSCDVLNATTNTVLQAELNPTVTSLYSIGHPNNAITGYQFWVTNPHGGFSRRITLTHAAPGTGAPAGTPAAQKASYFKLSSMSSTPPAIPLEILLNVRVRAYIAGAYNEFGPACRLLLPPTPCQTTQLTTTADPVVSCGATGLFFSSVIYATALSGATAYQFEFSKPGYTRRITSPTRSQALSFVTVPLLYNNCYQVRVRVTFDGGNTFCPFGPYCNITLGTASCGTSGMALEGDGDETITAEDAHLILWPNPNDGSTMNVALTESDATVNTVTMDVTDVFGKLVSTRTLPLQDGRLNTVVDFEQELAAGLYLVHLQAGTHRYTERLVIQ